MSRLGALVVLGVSLALAMPSTAAGQDGAALALERGVLEIVVNGRSAGEAIVLLRRSDVLVPLDVLREAGLSRLSVATETHDGVTYVALSSASPVLTHAVDMNELVVRIDAEAGVFGTATIDMASRPPEGMRHVSDPGVFLNYAPRFIDGARFEGFGEIGATYGPALALGTLSHDPDHGAVRLLTRVTIDDRGWLARITFGDTVASSGSLGGGALIGGISMTTNMELDPYLVRLPTLGFNGGVTSPSTLDVYVNDTLVRSTPLAPGEFQVANLPPVNGAGSTRYVIRDAFGRERTMQSSYYGAANLLAPGLHDYSYAVGFVRERFGIESLAYGEPVFAARHRYGFSSSLSAGARLEVGHEQASWGVGVTVSPGLGELEIGVGASATWSGLAGMSGLLRYSYNGRPFSIATLVRALSDQYTTISLDADTDRLLLEHATTASLAIHSSTSIAARVVYAFARDRLEPTVQLGLDVAARLGSDVNLTVGATTRYDQGAWEHELIASLRIALPDHHSASVGARASTDGTGGGFAQIARPIMGRVGLGYHVNGALGTSNRMSVAVRGRSPFGSLDASYTNLDGDAHTLIRGSIGVVLVPGAGVFLRDPTDESYAVVHVPEVEGARVYLNNQEIGRTDSSGMLFVQGLRAYQANRLRIDASDLPLDHEIGEHEQLIAPTYRGAARVTFEGRRVRLARGRIRIVSSAGEAWARFGDLEVLSADQSWTSPLGTGGEFELDGVPAGEWRAIVRSHEGTCVLSVVVPESDELFVDLGTLRCAAGDGGGGEP